MAVVLKEQLELRPSVALQKKVGLKSLEQVIRWGDSGAAQVAQAGG